MTNDIKNYRKLIESIEENDSFIFKEEQVIDEDGYIRRVKDSEFTIQITNHNIEKVRDFEYHWVSDVKFYFFFKIPKFGLEVEFLITDVDWDKDEGFFWKQKILDVEIDDTVENYVDVAKRLEGVSTSDAGCFENYIDEIETCLYADLGDAIPDADPFE